MRTTVLMIVVLVASCGSPNQLWGSIRESHTMEFNRVEIVRQGHALRIEYVRERGADQEWVCKLTVDTEGLELSDHAEIRASSFTDRVVVERNANEQEPLPRYTGGLLYFERYSPLAGDAIDGDFNILFDNGRNLAGTFASTLEVEDVTELVPGPGEGEIPLSMPPTGDVAIGDATLVGTSCAACPPHGVLVGLWWVRRRRRPKQPTS